MTLLGKIRASPDGDEAGASDSEEEQELFRFAFEESESALCLIELDPDGYRLRQINRMARRLVGIGDRDVAGRAIADILPATAAGYFRAVLDAALERSAPTTIQDWLDMPNGRQYWIAVLKPLPDADGSVRRLLVTGRNATDDQRAIGRLRRNRLLVERLARTSPGIVYLYAPGTGLYSFLSAHVEQTLGHARDAGPDLSDALIHPDDRQRVETCRAMLRGEDENQIVECSFRMLHRDGSYRWMQSREMRRESGDAAVVGVAIDITATIVAQDQIRTLSERLTSLQNEERRRIAQELHDSTAQHLAALSLGMLQLRHLGPGDDHGAVLDDMQAMLTEAHREISAVTYLLHPPYLDVEGLEVSLTHFVKGFRKRTGLSIDLSIRGSLDGIARECATVIYRIVQEAVTNVHRHAKASHADIEIARDPAQVRFAIIDDGVGFATAPSNPHGIGVDGMRVRMDQFGGAFEIVSGPMGTSVRATMPLDSKCLE